MKLRSLYGTVGILFVGAVAVITLAARELRGQVTPSHFRIFVQVLTTSDPPFINISENTGFAVSTPYSAAIQFLIAVPSTRWGELPLDNTLIRVSAKKDGQEVMDGVENTAEVNERAVFADSPYPPSCSQEHYCLTSLAFLRAASVIPGTYNITISANDGTDATSAAFTWTVLPEELHNSASSKETIASPPSSAPTGISSSAASSFAEAEVCGNGVKEAGEVCDQNPNITGGQCPTWQYCMADCSGCTLGRDGDSSNGGPSSSMPSSESSSPLSSSLQSPASASAASSNVSSKVIIDVPSSPVSSAAPGSIASSSQTSSVEEKDTQKKAFCCDVVAKSTTPVSHFLKVYIPSLWVRLKGGPTCKMVVFVKDFEQAKMFCDRLSQVEEKRPITPPDGGKGTGGDGSSKSDDGKEKDEESWDWSDDTADDDGDGSGEDGGNDVGGGECCVAPDGTIIPVLPPPSTFAGQAWATAKEAAEWVIDIFYDVELNPLCGGSAALTKGAQCGGGGGGKGGQFGECTDGMDNDTDDFVDADDPDCSDFDGENYTYNPARFERPCETGEAVSNLPVASLLAQGAPCNPPQLGWACCFNNRTCSQFAIPSPYPSSIDDLPCSRSNMYGVTEAPLGGRPIFGLASAARDACRARCGQSSSGGGNSSAPTYSGQRVCCSRTTSSPQRPTCTAMTVTEPPTRCRGHVYTTEPPQNWDDSMAACRNECGFPRLCCNQLTGQWKEFFVTMNELSPCTTASRISPYSDVPVELQLSFPSFLSPSPAYDLRLPSTAPACPLKRICCNHVSGEWQVTTNQTCRAVSPPRPQVLFADWGPVDPLIDPIEGPYNKNSFNRCLRFMVCANITKRKCEATTSDRPCRQLGPDQYMPEEYSYSIEGLTQCQSDVQPENPPPSDQICCRRTTSTVPRFACVSSYQRYCNDQIGGGQISVKEYGNAPDARARCAAECPTTIWCYSKKDGICKDWPFPPDTTNISAACLGFCGAMTKESCEANCR